MTIQVTDTIRVESGKVRKRAIATKELLDDAVTAKHYKLVIGRDKEGKPIPGRGSDGRVIELGKEMEYLDHKSKALEWVVYQHNDGRYEPVSRHKNEAEALTVARKLAEEAA